MITFHHTLLLPTCSSFKMSKPYKEEILRNTEFDIFMFCLDVLSELAKVFGN